MPPKTGKGKAAAKKVTAASKNKTGLPDRLTWPGWIEMESEPAFFNVMLKDMGVRGVKVNEVWSLDADDLAMLPQPVHALIFLFRYQTTDKAKLETECPKQVWYAEQVPDFACATFALLNIVNNIPGLEMGKELRSFKDSTQDMTPRLRGEAVDEFTFVKCIHNSFARDEDLLQANLHLKEKLTKIRREQAAAKAKITRAANAAARAFKAARVVKSSPSEETVAKAARASRSSPSDEKTAEATPASKSSPSEGTPDEETSRGTRASKRLKNPTAKAMSGTPPRATSKSASSSKIESDEKFQNGEITPKKESKSPSKTPSKTNRASKTEQQSESSSSSTCSKRKGTFSDHEDEATESIEEDNQGSSPPKAKANANKKLKLNGPKRKAGSNPDAAFTAAPPIAEQAEVHPNPRRSTREAKPRKDLKSAAEQEAAAAAETHEVDEAGFHFCAYMPIGDRVWKLDGMDGFPQDMGLIGDGVDWLNIAQPALQERIAQYAAGSIEFNLMAVVHDPIMACVEALAANVKSLEATEAKLAEIADDWKELLDDKEKSNTLVDGHSNGLGLHNVDIERAELTNRDEEALEKAQDLSQLLDLRREIVLQQSGLRRACEDEMYSSRSDDSRAMIRRQDYTAYCDEAAARS